jgi:dyslexia susceptibility 1 candidate gene 1 protein
MEIDKWKDQGPKDIWTGKKEPLPAPLRQTGEISVHFTYREFSTAARESKYAEEQEWLAKMAAARKIKSSDTSDINEANPEFLKDKGINFFKAGNYEAAINVFTEAIKSNNLLPSLYANRAACYLSIGKYEDCIDDCGKALDLYYPVVPSNYLSRAKVFVRRGTAYASMEDYHLALQDYDSALKLSPNDEKLKDDYEKIKEFATKNPKH